LDLEEDGGQDLTLDLSDVTFIDPAGLVILASLAELKCAEGLSVFAVAPALVETANYASRMGLGDTLAENCGAANTFPVTRRNEVSTLLELRRYETEDDADTLIQEVDNCLMNAGLLPGERQPVLEILLEIAQNSIEHSGTNVGYFAAQAYGSMNDDRRVAIAVGDYGRGIRQSFAGTRYESESDAEAILRAAESGVSRYQDPSRGKGLPYSIGHQGVARAGRFTIRSGLTTVSFSSGSSTSRTRNWLPGTLITALIYC
jgi:hypothetical protein